jgi:predicted secreted protein
MSSGAVAGVGTTFSRATPPANTVFVAIAEVNSISGPTMQRNQIDVTSLDSTGGYKEFIAGMKDSGEISLSMNFTMGTWGTMKSDFDSNTARVYKIVLPDSTATTFQFSGLVTACPFAAITPDEKITCDVTIKITGVVTVTS